MIEITRQNEDHSEHPIQGRRTLEDRRYDKKNVSPPKIINETTMRRRRKKKKKKAIPRNTITHTQAHKQTNTNNTNNILKLEGAHMRKLLSH